ncbi:MAG: YkgJ family cysteine cluster protein [Acidimicrobiales bacterium]
MDDEPLDTTTLPAWLDAMGAALRGDADADVACGTCTACCRSRQFVHVAPDETDTLAHLPTELLVPAPGLPAGHRILGYDADGRCPMLGAHGCTIYDHRPRTCRTYDCRVFAATGLDPTADGKPAIGDQARRWRFADADSDAHRALAAELAAAAQAADGDATARAVRAVAVVLRSRA